MYCDGKTGGFSDQHDFAIYCSQLGSVGEAIGKQNPKDVSINNSIFQ